MPPGNLPRSAGGDVYGLSSWKTEVLQDMYGYQHDEQEEEVGMYWENDWNEYEGEMEWTHRRNGFC